MGRERKRKRERERESARVREREEARAKSDHQIDAARGCVYMDVCRCVDPNYVYG